MDEIMRFLFNYGSRPSRQQLTAHKVNGQYLVATYRQFSGFVTEVDVYMPRTGEVVESAVYTHRTDDLLTANEVHAQTCQSMRDGKGQAWDSVAGWREKRLTWGRERREVGAGIEECAGDIRELLQGNYTYTVRPIMDDEEI